MDDDRETFDPLPENVPGPVFVDESCIRCAACWKTAPEIFTSHPIEAYAFVFKQPQTPEDWELSLKAKSLCPVSAIHVDEGGNLKPSKGP